jgi:Arc/MetJ family transcription regulator
MRTNIEIDDKLMEAVMATGKFKTKREAVEEGLRMIKRRKAYDALLAARGTLHWDDSDEGWAQRRAQQALQANEAEPAPYLPAVPTVAQAAVKKAPARAAKTPSAKRGQTK